MPKPKIFLPNMLAVDLLNAFEGVCREYESEHYTRSRQEKDEDYDALKAEILKRMLRGLSE